ncbi:hypothetical protein KP615_09385 [Treponema denticola]|uniref:hypothetical protein n=1 Tax=Treponema denticola TaxID=158 RepID=UPI003D00072B
MIKEQEKFNNVKNNDKKKKDIESIGIKTAIALLPIVPMASLFIGAASLTYKVIKNVKNNN